MTGSALAVLSIEQNENLRMAILFLGFVVRMFSQEPECSTRGDPSKKKMTPAKPNKRKGRKRKSSSGDDDNSDEDDFGYRNGKRISQSATQGLTALHDGISVHMIHPCQEVGVGLERVFIFKRHLKKRKEEGLPPLLKEDISETSDEPTVSNDTDSDSS